MLGAAADTPATEVLEAAATTVAVAGSFADTPADTLDRLGTDNLAVAVRTAVLAVAKTAVWPDSLHRIVRQLPTGGRAAVEAY